MPREITDEKLQELARMSKAELGLFRRKVQEEFRKEKIDEAKANGSYEELMKPLPAKDGKKPKTTMDNIIIDYWKFQLQRINKVKNTASGQQETLEQGRVEHLLSMNIYDSNKVLLRNNGLHRIPLRGKITIKNPIELDDAQKKELTDVKNMPQAYYQNIKLIISTLDNIFTETETKQLSINFPVNKYLGAIDVSKKENRIAVYQYWEKIAKLYPKVKAAIEGFFEAIDESTLSDERKEKFQRLHKKTISSGGGY